MNADVNPLVPAIRTVATAYTGDDAEPTAAHFRESAGALRQAASQAPREYLPVLRYHEARLLALSGDVTAALAILNELLAVDRPLPEALWLKIQLAAAGDDDRNAQLRWELENRLGELLPLSAWGRLLDARLKSQLAAASGRPLSLGPRPAIPLIDAQKLQRIAQLFEDMGFYAEAANAYREAIYCGFIPPEFPRFGSETWFSDQAADLWLSTARVEANIDRDVDAFHALCMGIAPSPARLRRALSVLDRLASDSPGAGDRRPDRKRLEEIAALYRACNLHPRALWALNEAAGLPGEDVTALRQAIDQEWNERVAQLARGTPEITFLFGQRIGTRTDDSDLAPAPYRPVERRSHGNALAE